MFTGIIEKLGVLRAIIRNNNSCVLEIHADFSDLIVGESIAVNGVCLTLLPVLDAQIMRFDVSPETLKSTNLSLLSVGMTVNLERAMLASTRFGGHYVSGHVDRTSVVISTAIVANNYFELRLGGFSAFEHAYLLPKGSITVEGVSLTINSVQPSDVSSDIVEIGLLLVPHTLAHTTLGNANVGDYLNIEFDYLARIVVHQLRIKNNDI